MLTEQLGCINSPGCGRAIVRVRGPLLCDANTPQNTIDGTAAASSAARQLGGSRSGNWVKVVQRIPVRTSVECREGDPPLRVGMSATIEIDTGHKRSFRDILKAIGF